MKSILGYAAICVGALFLIATNACAESYSAVIGTADRSRIDLNPVILEKEVSVPTKGFEWVPNYQKSRFWTPNQDAEFSPKVPRSLEMVQPPYFGSKNGSSHVEESSCLVSGPGCGGGGDIARASKQDILLAIQQAREILKNPNLHRIVTQANSFDPNGIEAKKLTYIISLLDYSGDQGWWSEKVDPKPNKIADRIGKIPMYTLEFDVCPSSNQDHAEASVFPRTVEGVMCFSIFELKKESRDTIGLHVLGLMIHEYTHMLGFNEENADLIQKMFVTSYPQLNPTYSSPESRLFRSIKKDVKNYFFDNYLEFAYENSSYMSHPDVYLRHNLQNLIDIKNASFGLSLRLEESPTIKICKKLEDNDHQNLSKRYHQVFKSTLDLESNYNQFKKYQSIDLYLEMYLAKIDFFLINKLSCLPTIENICKSKWNEISFLWHQVAKIFYAYKVYVENMSSYIKVRSLYEGELFDDFKVNENKTKELLSKSLFTLVGIHSSLIRIKDTMNDVFADLNKIDKSCSTIDNQRTYLQKFYKEVLNLKMDWDQSLIDPLRNYFKEEQVNLLVSKYGEAMSSDLSPSLVFLQVSKKYQSDYLNEAFRDLMYENLLVERKSLHSTFHSSISFFEGSGFPKKDVDLEFDPNEFCQGGINPVELDECRRKATAFHKAHRSKTDPPLYQRE